MRPDELRKPDSKESQRGSTTDRRAGPASLSEQRKLFSGPKQKVEKVSSKHSSDIPVSSKLADILTQEDMATLTNIAQESRYQPRKQTEKPKPESPSDQKEENQKTTSDITEEQTRAAQREEKITAARKDEMNQFIELYMSEEHWSRQKAINYVFEKVFSEEEKIFFTKTFGETTTEI